jgi:hypothetical protein
VQAFQGLIALTTSAAPIDQDLAMDVDWDTAYRDAAEGGQVPARWMLSKGVAGQKRAQAQQQRAQQQAQQQQLAVAGQLGDAAQKFGQAAPGLQQLLQPPGGQKAQFQPPQPQQQQAA